MKYLTKFAFFVAWLFLCAANLLAVETKPHIVLLSGESLYGSATTLPKFAKRLEQQYGYRCTTIVRDEEHRFPSLDALDQADLVVVFARRMQLPAEQLGQVKRYVESGRPVIGLRTASHAHPTPSAMRSISSAVALGQSFAKNSTSPPTATAHVRLQREQFVVPTGRGEKVDTVLDHQQL